jgi:uncharacterized protein (DUF1697 family)
VNVGKGKRVPMAALRQLLAALAKTLHVWTTVAKISALLHKGIAGKPSR